MKILKRQLAIWYYNYQPVDQGQLVADQSYLDQMRDYLSVIHDEFAILYDVEGIEGFGTDIEYKVTADEQLVIKQARPWVSFGRILKLIMI